MIRPMIQSDLSACADILCSVYNNDLWQCNWDKGTAEAYLSDFFHAAKFVGFVIELEGEILGGIFAREKIWWNTSEVFVEEMFIRPDRQGKGLGSMLLGEMEAYVREKGLAGITLSTNRYAPAPAFYRKNGFVDCGHVLYMAKEIEG